MSYKAEITLLKTNKQTNKKTHQRNRHKFLDFQMSDKSCGRTKSILKKKESLTEKSKYRLSNKVLITLYLKYAIYR